MSQSGVYSELKPVWWYAREGGLPDAPKQVQVILSDLCNQDCHFCAYRMSGYSSNQLFTADADLSSQGHNNPIRRIPTERALSLMEEIRRSGCLAVQFTGGGEPTVHPDHEKVFERALLLGLRCSLVSNGVKWSRDLIHDILPSFDWVRVSIDAPDAASYARTRRCPEGHWSRVWRNVAGLAAAIENRKSQTAFGLGYVVTPESFQGIVEFARLARLSGASNVRYTAMFSTEDEAPFVPIYDRVRVLIDEAKRLQTGTFKVYDNFGSRFDDLRQHAPDYSFCSYQHYTTYIGGDLTLYRCCVLAYNKRGKVRGGDLRNRAFDEYWFSEDRKKDFGEFDARGCERCQFNQKNRNLLYVMGNTASDTSPRHLEWT